jgi:glycosyltransferase involved in cell wall biosynthesis
MSAGSPKTVLHIVDSLGLSGKTRNLVSIVSALDRRRFQPVVCTLTAEPSPLFAQLTGAGVAVCTIPCADGLNPGAALRLARLAWSMKADLVHCYNPRPMLYGGFAARAAGARAALGFLSAFACQVPDRSYTFLPQPLATVSRRNVYRNRLAARLMRAIVTVAPSLGRRFCQFNDVPVEKLRVIPYAADLRSIDAVTPARAEAFREAIGLRADDVVIGSVGRLVEQKDYPTQLRAFAMAIVGDGPLRSTLEQMAVVLGIADRVKFLGERNDVPAFLKSIDLFALASKFEPFGVALLEAKAAGLPIVATAVNEIPDIVGDGESGRLTPPGDPAIMAALFAELAADRHERTRLGTRARREAERQSLSASVAAYEMLYDVLLENHSRASWPIERAPHGSRVRV